MSPMSTRRRSSFLLLLCTGPASAWVQSHAFPLRARKSSSLTSRFAVEMFVEPAAASVHSSLDYHATALTTGLDHNTWTTLLTTSLQAGGLTISPNTLQPAHGHMASWFGTPDPYLETAKSIAPSAKALQSMGLGQSVPRELPEALQKVLSQGWQLLDSRTIAPEDVLPGITANAGILPVHQAPPETPASFAATVEWSARYLKVVDKLPEAALAYTMVEFFLLRPNIDLYKEEIREEPGAVAMETAVTTGVRLFALGVVGALTLGIFG